MADLHHFDIFPMTSPGDSTLSPSYPQNSNSSTRNDSLLYQRDYSPPVTSASSKRTTPLESMYALRSGPAFSAPREKTILPRSDEYKLLPSHMPPEYHVFDLFPSLLVAWLMRRGKEVKGKKAAKLRAEMLRSAGSHNIPLELSLYLVSLPIVYIYACGYLILTWFSRVPTLQLCRIENRLMIQRQVRCGLDFARTT